VERNQPHRETRARHDAGEIRHFVHATLFNQAGALVNAYTDGTVLLNHGGTEMGQGLHVKVAQVVAAELGLPLSAVRVTTTDTSKVPNTSATAASSGSDLNGKAAQAAARTIRERLVELICVPGALRLPRFDSRTDRFISALRACPLPTWPERRTPRACHFRPLASTGHRIFTTTAIRCWGSRFTITPTAPPSRKSRSIR